MKKGAVIIAIILIVVLLACCLAGGGFLLYRRYQQKQSTQGFKDVWNQYLTANNKINTKIDEYAKLEQERNDLVDKLETATNVNDNIPEVLKIVDEIEDNVDKQQAIVDEINTAVLGENGLVMQLATESAKVEPATLKLSAANLAAKAAEGNSVEMEYRALLQTGVDIDRKFIIIYRDAANGVISADEFTKQQDNYNAELDTNNTARTDKANEWRALRDEVRRQWAAIQNKL